MSLLLRAGMRHLLRHRLQCALALSGIALGVAIVVGIQAVQSSARAAFAQSFVDLFGRTTHVVSATDGRFDEQVLATVRQVAPLWQPAPVVAGRVRAGRGPDSVSLQVIGVDPISAALRPDVAPAFDIIELMRAPGAAVITRETAERLALASGDELVVDADGTQSSLTIIGIAERAARGERTLAANVVLVDIATAQELLGMAGQLTRIELEQDSDAEAGDVQAALRARLPATVTLADQGRRQRSAQQLTRAFYTNLDALSLLALLVGGFMIYNTIAFLAVQRGPLFARLRALGVRRASIARLVAIEAVVLGAAGGCVGNVLGYALAAALLDPVSRTLSDHYFDSAPQQIGFTPALFAVGIVLAIVSALAAALVPALTAARAAPDAAGRASRREADSAGLLAWGARAGLVVAVLGAALLGFSSRSLVAGFGALGCLLLAATLLVPRLTQGLLAALDRALSARLPLPERLALRGAARSMGRIGMAIAALMAATATSVGIGLMVDSFRGAVDDWLRQLLRAEFYVSQDFERSEPPSIAPALMTRLLADPRVAALSKVRRADVPLGDTDVRVTAYDLPPAARAGFRFVAGDAADVWRHWDDGTTVIVSEPLAWHRRIAPGDTLTLTTPSGPREMTVTGVYADYGNERGVIAIGWTSFTRLWRDPRAHGLGIYPADGTDLAALERDLSRLVADRRNLTVWSNAAVRRESLAVFDRTFAITDVLTLFAALIAALGVFNALLALNLERAREFAILRATGARRALIRRCLHAQTLVVATAAVLCALPLGVAIAVLLIEIINVRSFGWSMPFTPSFAALVMPCLLAVGAALAATVYPAERAVRVNPAGALRYE